MYRTNVAALRSDLSAALGPPVDIVGTVRATAAAARQPEPRLVQDLRPGWSALLVTGPQPRFMTKWAVFWTLGMPLNAGLFWWLFYEAPWSARARAMPEPAGRTVRHTFDGRRRRGGGQMFLWLLLAGLVWSGLTTGVEASLSALLEPKGTVGVWTVELGSGSSPTELGADLCAYFPEDC